jgi:hypothetical protein
VKPLLNVPCFSESTLAEIIAIHQP